MRMLLSSSLPVLSRSVSSLILWDQFWRSWLWFGWLYWQGSATVFSWRGVSATPTSNHTWGENLFSATEACISPTHRERVARTTRPNQPGDYSSIDLPTSWDLGRRPNVRRIRRGLRAHTVFSALSQSLQRWKRSRAHTMDRERSAWRLTCRP